MRALVLVDLQNDFTPGLPGGALAVPRGDEVITVADRLLPAYPLVVATQDWHPADHLSFASQHAGRTVGEVITLDGIDQVLWPDHCIRGTPGAALCSALRDTEIDAVVRKGTDRRIDSYSGFFDNGHQQATGLEAVLRDRGVQEVHVLGLATDYCVKFTALDAVQLGFATTVITDGCHGVELQPGDSAKALAAMRQAGVELIDSATIARS